ADHDDPIGGWQVVLHPLRPAIHRIRVELVEDHIHPVAKKTFRKSGRLQNVRIAVMGIAYEYPAGRRCRGIRGHGFFAERWSFVQAFGSKWKVTSPIADASSM